MGYMPTMDQHIHMSFCPNSPPSDVVVLDETYATVSQYRLSQQQHRQPQQQQRQIDNSAAHSPENRRHDMQHDRFTAPPRQVSSDFIPAPHYAPPPSATQMEPPSSPMGRRS